ncbi:MAG: hypothetical protein ABIH25_02380 [Candidatus Woesearchaeota archaeon]
MLVKISLRNLLNTTAMFYLDGKFRNFVFSLLREKFGDWRIVAKHIGINVRHLFGLRRGFEICDNKKYKRYMSSKEIISISKLTKINLKQFEKNLNKIKVGTSGREHSLILPAIVDLEKEKVSTFRRSLADRIFFNIFENDIFIKPPTNLNKNKYFYITSEQITNQRKDNYQDRPLPNVVVFNEKFAKEFGKWVGDKCGGARKVGVSNKNIEFIQKFKDLILRLNQVDPKVQLILKPDFRPNKEITKYAEVISINKHQYGNYVYRVEVCNRILKEYVFDHFNKNLISILYYSPKSVRHAFFAGLIEAEGSISLDSFDISIAFGTQKYKDNKKIIKLLKTALLYKYLLKLDKIESYISRKYCKTKRSSTLKYDIRIKRDSFISFREKIIPYISHPKKLERLRGLENRLKKIKNKEKELVPEISIGLVGH